MEIGLTTFCFICRLVYVALRFLFRCVYCCKPPMINKLKDPLLELSATTLAKRIRHGELSSRVVVEAYIKRIREVNPIINAVVEDRFEAALLEAEECDAKLAAGEVTVEKLEKEKPLYGVPFTVKESCALKGLSLTGCSLSRKGVKATENSFATSTFINAGGIPLCVTNTPELCTCLNTTNFLYGTTKNPYDGRYSAGGSSGGEAALISSGGSILGIGSDLAGSIRVPALLNGIFGHKPTSGIIPIDGHFPMSDDPAFRKYLVLGPLARYAEDLQLAMKAMTAKLDYDLRLDEPVDIKRLRVFYMDNVDSFLGTKTPSKEIRQSIKAAVNHLVDSGASLEEVPRHWFRDIVNTLSAVFFAIENPPPILVDPKNPKVELSAYWELFKSLFGLSAWTKYAILAEIWTSRHAYLNRAKRERYLSKAEDLRLKVNNLLKDDGILIWPTFLEHAIYRQLLLLQMDSTIYPLIANIFQLPATHVPMGLSKNGSPFGFQVLAGPRQDRLCLAVARELEKKFGGWRSPGLD